MALPEATREALLSLYDAPDPGNAGKVVRGYDRDHADRATGIVMLMASRLGVPEVYLRDLEVAGLLHDIGRAGMDAAFFSRVFTLAQEHGLPLRVRELRARYPHVQEAEATSFFLRLLEPHLHAAGIPLDDRLVRHVRMRMDFKGCLREELDRIRPWLDPLGIAFRPWMEKVVLYYYYPQDMTGEPEDVRRMGMVLLACENFEAFNNSQRGRDYYGRRQERLREAFAALGRFQDEGLVTPEIIACLKELAASGKLDGIIKASRGLASGESLPVEDVAYLRELAPA